MGADMALLAQLGIKAALIDSGCCGMAGTFGFKSGHYALSLKAGEPDSCPLCVRPQTTR